MARLRRRAVILGHENVAIALDRYSHVVTAIHQDTVEAATAERIAPTWFGLSWRLYERQHDRVDVVKCDAVAGGMAERSIAAVLNTAEAATLPGDSDPFPSAILISIGALMPSGSDAAHMRLTAAVRATPGSHEWTPGPPIRMAVMSPAGEGPPPGCSEAPWDPAGVRREPTFPRLSQRPT